MLYSIGSFTKDFVREAAKSLDYYTNICARVRNFKQTFYADSPPISAYQSRFSRALSRLKANDHQPLRQLISDMDAERKPLIVEDPRFLWLRGVCRLSIGRHELSRARGDFISALNLNFSPPEDQIIAWFRAESSGDSSDSMTSNIMERVLLFKGYSSTFKTRIKFDRACFLYGRGRTLQSTDPYLAAEQLRDALALHLEAHREFANQDSTLLSKSEEYTRNTCYSLMQHYLRSSDPDEIFTILRKILSERRIYVDNLAEPLCYFIRIAMSNGVLRKDILQKRFSKFESILKDYFDNPRWLDKTLMTAFQEACIDIKDRFRLMLKELN